MSEITVAAKEQSTYILRISFANEDGDATVPKSCQWTLLNESEEIVNEREQVVATPLAAQMDIVLSGNDLDLSDGRQRVFVVEAVYDGLTQNDLPLRDQFEFPIEGLAYV